MATTVRAASTNSNTTGTAVSVTAPAGTATGDLVVCVVHGNGQITIADNNGSTAFTKAAISGDDGSGNYKPNTTGGQTLAVFTRRILGGDPSTYNFTLSATGRWGVVAITWQNPHASTIFDVTPTGGNSSDATNNNTGTAASITTTTDNAIHCVAMCPDGGSAQTFTEPSGYASQATTPGTAQPIDFSTKVITPAGATGVQTWSWTTDNSYFAVGFAIADVTSGGGGGGGGTSTPLILVRSNIRLGP
jgi:hypothetical protein